MVKRGFAAALALCLALAAPLYAESGDVRLEQVQIELPEVRAYFYIEDDAGPTAEITASLGGAALAVDEVRRYDGARDATSYFFLVDCSTSTTAGQMSAVKQGLADFAGQMSPGDTLTLISFGVEVQVVLQREQNADAILAAAEALSPDEPGTVFFDALAKAIDLAGSEEFALERKLAFVFSDSVDYNLGGHTKDEIDKLLAATGLPFYALGFDTGTKEQLDNFGAVARASGGTISIVNEAQLPDTLAQLVEMTDNAYVATLAAAGNLVSQPQQEFELAAGGKRAAMQVPVRFWQPDNAAPAVLGVEQHTAESISIAFSEAVQGAESADSYVVKNENGDLMGIRAAAYDAAAGTTELSFASSLPTGSYTLACPGVTDISMEQNPVAGTVPFSFEGTAEEAPAEAQPQSGGVPAGVWFVITIIAIAIIAAAVLATIRKRRLVLKDDKLYYADGVEVEQQLADSPEVQVHFVSTQLPQLRLMVTVAGSDSRVVEVPINKTLFVGRSEICDVVFDDETMSRQHFVIGEENGTYTLTNLSNSGGTRLNGVPVQNPRPLRDGDTIEAGQESIRFFTLKAGSGGVS